MWKIFDDGEQPGLAYASDVYSVAILISPLEFALWEFIFEDTGFVRFFKP